MPGLVHRDVALVPVVERAVRRDARHRLGADLARVQVERVLALLRGGRELAVPRRPGGVLREEVEIQRVVAAPARALQIRVVLLFVVDPAAGALVDEERRARQVVDDALRRVQHERDVVLRVRFAQHVELRGDDLVRDERLVGLGAGEVEIHIHGHARGHGGVLLAGIDGALFSAVVAVVVGNLTSLACWNLICGSGEGIGEAGQCQPVDYGVSPHGGGGAAGSGGCCCLSFEIFRSTNPPPKFLSRSAAIAHRYIVFRFLITLLGYTA